jgi:hypothetical protein
MTNLLTQFKEIIPVHAEDHKKTTNTKRSVTEWQIRWYLQLPIGVKVLNISMNLNY